MKVLWLINNSMMLEATANSIQDVVTNQIKIYKNGGCLPKDRGLPECLLAIEEHKPDVIFFIGAGNGPDVWHPDDLKKIKEKAKFIHICVDGGCPGWWSVLELYKENNCFDLTVSIDGSYKSPAGTVDLVTLTPGWELPYKFGGSVKRFKDKDYYPSNSMPLDMRPEQLGFMGGLGSQERQDIVGKLIHLNLLTFNNARSEAWGTYKAYAEFMCCCQSVLNLARTGMNLHYMHVKNRVIETALAKACLFEQKGSPIHHWFVKDEDYLEWESPYDVMKLLAVSDKQKIANSLNAKVKEFHSPAVWFNKIVSKL